MNPHEYQLLGELQQSIKDIARRLQTVENTTNDTLSELRQANSTAAEAKRLADANSSDIKSLQEWRGWTRKILEPFGGLEGLVARVTTLLGDVGVLNKTHADSDLVRDEHRKIRNALIRGLIAGGAIAGSVMTAVAVVTGWF